ncbi:MAG: hypothetical protein RLZZ399_870 [Verrucomicrobiota bacterium]|jgi:hypothetical protein
MPKHSIKSWVILVVVLCAAGLILYGPVAAAVEGARKGYSFAKQINQLRNIGMALKQFANDHEGKFPENLDQLVQSDGQRMESLLPGSPKVTYEYLGAQLSPSAPPHSVLLRIPPEQNGRISIVLRLDGSAGIER